MRSKIITNLFLCSVVLIGNVCSAKAQNVDYSVHSTIIYRFTKYMAWPESQKKGDFVIGVIGETPLFDELTAATSNKKAGNQNIVVKILSHNQSSYACQILVISEGESSCLKRVSTLLQGKPVLIVTEQNGLAQKGSCINFIITDGRVKLEINKNNIEARNLKIASELIGLGTLVQ